MVRILILILGTRDKRYQKAISKIQSTYLSILPSNIDHFFYYGSGEEPISSHRNIFLDCSDELKDVHIKTYEAYRALIENDMLKNYDYIIRPNLSNYIDIPLMHNFLHQRHEFSSVKPTCFAPIAATHLGIKYPAGCGYIISSSITKLIPDNKKIFYDDRFQGSDDVALGLMLERYNITMETIERCDTNYHRAIDNSFTLKPNCFVYRCKKTTAAHDFVLTDMDILHSKVLKRMHI